MEELLVPVILPLSNPLEVVLGDCVRLVDVDWLEVADMVPMTEGV